MSWHEDKIIPKGHQMSMKNALQVVSMGIFFKLMLPDWILKLTKRLQTIRIAYNELPVQIAHFTDIDRYFLNVIIQYL